MGGERILQVLAVCVCVIVRGRAFGAATRERHTQILDRHETAVVLGAAAAEIRRSEGSVILKKQYVRGAIRAHNIECDPCVNRVCVSVCVKKLSKESSWISGNPTNQSKSESPPKWKAFFHPLNVHTYTRVCILE